jgi:phosphohistidine phosphatase SixA
MKPAVRDSLFETVFEARDVGLITRAQANELTRQLRMRLDNQGFMQPKAALRMSAVMGNEASEALLKEANQLNQTLNSAEVARVFAREEKRLGRPLQGAEVAEDLMEDVRKASPRKGFQDPEVARAAAGAAVATQERQVTRAGLETAADEILDAERRAAVVTTVEAAQRRIADLRKELGIATVTRPAAPGERARVIVDEITEPAALGGKSVAGAKHELELLEETVRQGRRTRERARVAALTAEGAQGVGEVVSRARRTTGTAERLATKIKDEAKEIADGLKDGGVIPTGFRSLDGQAPLSRLAELAEQLPRMVEGPAKRANEIEQAAISRALDTLDAADVRLHRETQRQIENQAKADRRTVQDATKSQYRRAQKAAEAIDERYPTNEQLLQRVDAYIGGLTSFIRSEAELGYLPRTAVRKIIERWLKDSRILLDAVGASVSSSSAGRAGQSGAAFARGDTPNSFVNALIRRRDALQASIRTVVPEIDTAVLRVARTRVTAARKADQRFLLNKLEAREAAAGVARLSEDSARSIANDMMAAEVAFRFGPGAPPKYVQDALDQIGRFDRRNSFSGVENVVQMTKNTMFGPDFGVFGIQLWKAAATANVPIMAGMVNRTLAALSLPHARTAMLDTRLSRTVQQALDGLGTGIIQSPVQAEIGTLASPILRRSGSVGRAVDTAINRTFGELARIQFQVVLGYARGLIYEGNLTMAHLARQNVDDPRVRRAAAEFANAATSYSREALRPGRRTLEKIAFTSPSMTRAMVDQVKFVARGLGPKASPTERILAATTIASALFGTLVMGKFINDEIGITNFVFDPSKPGFGLITLKNGTTLNVMPQQTLVKAFARSLRAIAEEDPSAAGRAWAQLVIGRTSIVGSAILGTLGFGFEEGAGFRFGDISRRGRLLNLAPLPPTLMTALVEDTNASRLLMSSFGVGAFPTRSFILGRELDEAEFEQLTPEQQAGSTNVEDFLEANPREGRALLNSVATPEQQAERTRINVMRAEEAVGQDAAIQTAIDAQRTRVQLATDNTESGEDFRDQVNLAGEIFRAEIEDFGLQFGDPTTESAQDRTAWVELFAQSEVEAALTGEEVGDAFARLEGALFDSWGLDTAVRQDRLWRELYAVTDPEASGRLRDLQATKLQLQQAGFWELDTRAWSDVQVAFPNVLTDVSSFNAYLSAKLVEELARLTPSGQDPELYREDARQSVEQLTIVKTYRKFFNSLEREWIIAHADDGAAAAALRFGYGSFTEAEREFIQREAPPAPEPVVAPEPVPSAAGRPVDPATLRAIELRDQGLTQGQIAIELGLTTDQVRKRLARARQRESRAAATV